LKTIKYVRKKVNIKGKGISKHNITLIVIVLVLILNSLCQYYERNDKPMDRLNLPIYPEISDVSELERRVEGLQGIAYIVPIAYPSKGVLKYYDKELNKTGFIINKPESFINDREWRISYDDIYSRNPIDANLQAFWLNINRRQAIRLELFCDLRDKMVKYQVVVVYILNLKSKKPIDTIDIYDEFSTAFDTIPGTEYIEDNIIQSEFSGFYSLEREFDFRIIHEIEKGTDIKSGTYTLPDRDGRYHMVSKEPLIEKDDLDLIEIVTIQRKNLPRKSLFESLTGSIPKIEEFYQLFFHFKEKSISKIKQRLKGSKGYYIGIICNRKIIRRILIENPNMIKKNIYLQFSDKSELILFINRLEFKKK